MNEVASASNRAQFEPVLVLDAEQVSSSASGADVPENVHVTLQEIALEVQGAAIEAQKLALITAEPRAKETAVALQLTAARLVKAVMSLEMRATALLKPNLSSADASGCCEKGFESLTSGRISEAISSFNLALTIDPCHAASHKGMGDSYLQRAEPEEAIKSYEKAFQYRPDYPEVENNLALAYLAKFDHLRAQKAFQTILVRDHGLPETALRSFDDARSGRTIESGYASPFKLIDCSDQLSYLLVNKKIHSSFRGLVDAYRALLVQLQSDQNRTPYSPLAEYQLEPFRGYYDKLIYYRDSTRLSSPAVNPDLNWKAIEEEYADTQCLSFDDLLTQAALEGLRQFFLESTVFFRHSEAGFVGSYLTDGFCCGLVFQVIDELRSRLPRLLADKPLNNMWCYRYNNRGQGVRPHNGDGSVTINFYLTPDEANVGDPNGGGMVMYDKKHPKEWDWLTFNLHKDDPGIQAQISEYLKDAKATIVPYKCNRAVLFHSTLFHKTDPFHFRDDYESRRMNITMLFGRRGQESASLR